MRGLLESFGARVRVERLPVADYVVADGCLVERKHVVDLHDSLLRGRLWPQLGALRARAQESFLLVEGRDLSGPIHLDAIRGALLAAGDVGITVIRSTHRPDSAAWLYRLAHRRQVRRRWGTRPRYAQRPQSPPDRVPEAMLGALPGISHHTATALLARFGSIAGIVSASPTEWQEVRGIGEKRAPPWQQRSGSTQGASDSGVSRNRPRRAT